MNVLVVGVLFFMNFVTAADDAHSMQFEHIDTRRGLPQNTVRVVAQDEHGFVWIGTLQGLSRFDGNQAVSFGDFANSGNKPLSGEVRIIKSLPGGRLLVGGEHGLFVLNLKNYRLTALSSLDPLMGRRIHSLALLSSSRAIVGVGESSVLEVDLLAEKVLRKITLPASDEPVVVRSIESDDEGEVLLATNNAGLLKVGPADDKAIPVAGAEILGRQLYVVRNHSGVLYVGTQGRGLFRFDKDNGLWKTAVPYDKEMLSESVFDIASFADGRLAVATLHHGVAVIDGDKNIRFHTNSSENANSLSSNSVWSLYVDPDDALWVGTDSGVNRERVISRYVSGNSPASPDSTRRKFIVTSLHQSREGGLMVGTDGGGVCAYDIERSVCTRVLTGNNMESNYILSMQPAKGGGLYLATDAGMYFLASEMASSFTPMNGEGGPGYGERFIWVGEGCRGEVIASSMTGVYQLGAHGKFLPLTGWNDSPEFKPVTQVSCDDKGGAWWSTYGGGVLYFKDFDAVDDIANGVRHASSSGDVGDYALTLLNASSGQVFVGSTVGLAKYDTNIERFFALDGMRQGTPVFSLVEDESGNVWVGGGDGLYVYRRGRLRRFSLNDAFHVREFNSDAVLRLGRGRLAFGGVGGIDIINARALSVSSSLFPPSLVDVRVSGNSIPFPSEKLGSSPFAATELKLKHDDAVVNFVLANLRRGGLADIDIEYRMSGLHEDWQRLQRSRGEVGYSSLPPGEYVFEARATDGESVSDTRRLSVNVSGPWWASWPALIAYTVLMAVGFGVYRKSALNALAKERAYVQELTLLDKQKNDFLATTSHELRTPLIGIIGVAETLRDGGVDSPEFIRNRLGMIVSSGKRLSKLVDDILDVTRLKEGKLEVFPKPIELRAFVAFTIETFSVMFNQPQERVVNAVPLGSVWVLADESRLEQVLFNLLSNALKYAPMGEVVIDCSGDGEMVTVRVCDKGIGVADAMKASIFEDFAQAHTDSGAGGVGLGLPICRYLLALHGGRIWVEDNPIGQGSCFLFTLPRVREGAEGYATEAGLSAGSRPARERTAIAQEEEVLSRPGPGAHVLVADDERVCRCVMGDFLADAGYRVSIVRDGGEAMAFVDAHDDLDLICVDVVMPVASGLAVCQHVRERYPLTELPILVMSAKTQMQDIVAGLSVGANDYVAKPVDKGEFLARVTNLVALRSAFQLRQQRDEAQELARASMRLALHHANTDSLTGLPLRNVLNAYLQDYVADGSHACGALFVDLDRLGKVNASYGHSVGDEILKQTAGRLRELLKGESHVVRFEGDQFLIALGGLPLAHQQCYSQLVELAGRCVAALAEPFHVAGNSISIASSLGISLFPFVSQSVEELIRHASIAMRHAKSRSSTHFLFYEASMEAGGRYAFELESRMREALKNGEFELHYQPQIDIATGTIGGVEALIRWRNPDKGLVPPGQFIPLAEENGFIVEIGRWVLEQACRDYCRWQEEGLQVDKVAVNLSAVQFREDGLVELVAKTLRETGMPAQNLELEITESATMDNMERTLQVLRELHGLGCILSIDDFGTGYSSLSYLKQFPVHALKIDQSFVRDVLKDEESRAIIQSIITLAHSLHLHTIAEGIETAEQFALLAELGSEEGQGYYFSKPLPEPAFQSFARNFSPFRH